MAIRFRPGGARPFLRTPASELVDVGAPLEALWGPAGADLPDRLYETEGDEALLSACVRSLRRTGQNDQAQTYENRLREAREQSERLRRLQSRADLSPSDAEALMALADEYRQRGNPVMARLEARRVLKIHPNHAAARRLMDEVTLPAS